MASVSVRGSARRPKLPVILGVLVGLMAPILLVGGVWFGYEKIRARSLNASLVKAESALAIAKAAKEAQIQAEMAREADSICAGLSYVSFDELDYVGVEYRGASAEVQRLAQSQCNASTIVNMLEDSQYEIANSVGLGQCQWDDYLISGTMDLSVSNPFNYSIDVRARGAMLQGGGTLQAADAYEFAILPGESRLITIYFALNGYEPDACEFRGLSVLPTS